MIVRRIGRLSRWFMAAALVGLLPFLAPPQLLIAVAVLLLRLSLVWNRSIRYELLVLLVNALALPVVAGSIWLNSLAGLALALPALPWFEEALRRASASFVATPSDPTLWQSQVPLPAERAMTPVSVRLVASLLLAALVGILADQPAMVTGALTLLAFVGTLVVLAYRQVPTRFLVLQAPTTRVLAGESVNVVVAVSAQKPRPLSIAFENPNRWTIISPDRATIDGTLRVQVALTPPLAGPSTVKSSVRAVDLRGLTIARQDLDLVHLRVIPKAVYAAWLAQRYLEEVQHGTAPMAIREATQQGHMRHGIDYYGARPYEPGDALKDLFWKHTLKLQQYIVKERRDDWGAPVLIAANLDAGTPEEADRVAYDLLTSALTLAQDSVPMAFAAYTDAEVVRVTPPLSPRPAVLAALELIERIRVVPQPVRMLEPPQVLRLRRMMARLMETPTASTARLARILGFEYRALGYRTRNHPATQAIRQALAKLAPPTTLLIVSTSDSDADVLELTLERLKSLRVYPFKGLPDGRGRSRAFAGPRSLTAMGERG